MARLEFLTGDQQASIQASRETTTDIEKLVSTGKLRPDDPAIGSAITQAKAIGDDSSVLRLQAAIKVAPALNASGALPSGARGAAMGVPATWGRVGGTTADVYNRSLQSGDVTAALRASEGLKTTPYWDGNHFRTGYGSDTVTRPDGSTEVVSSVTRITPEDAERDLQRRTADYAGKIQATVGEAQWAAMPVGARAALVSIAYNYGHLPSDVEAAAKTGNAAAVASAIAAHAGDNNGANYSRRLAEAAAVTGQAAYSGNAVAAPSANGGAPFSQADVARNPYLLSAYFRTLAADPEDRGETVKATAEAAFKAIDAGIKPSDDAIALVYQAADRDKANFGFLASELTGKLAALGAAGMSGPDRAAFADQARAAAVAAPDIYHQAIATAAMTQAKQQESLQAEQPYTAAANRFGTPTPAAIDPAHPELAGQALAQRGVLSQHIGALDGTPPPPLLEKGDEPALRALLQGPQAAQVLPQIAHSMRPDDLDRLAREPAFKESVVGMSKSGDPGKMKSAYDFMNTLANRNPQTFRADFGDQGVKDLSVWLGLSAMFPPDEVAKRTMRANDPAQAGAIEDAKKAADKALEKLTPAAVVSKFSTGWGPFGTTAQAPVNPDGAANASMALRREYVTAYREAFASSGDVHAADQAATNLLKTKFAVSPTNGNRVMANAPENSAYYPPVDGSYDWMAKQLDGDVAKQIDAQFGTTMDLPATGRIGALPQYGNTKGEREAVEEYRAPRALFSDATTDADIAAHKPPSYAVVVQQPDGRFAALTYPDGTAYRQRFDPTPYQADFAAKSEPKRNALLNAPPLDMQIQGM